MKAKKNYGLKPFQSPSSWGAKPKIEHLIGKESNTIRGIRVETLKETFTIPVIDATHSPEHREAVERMERRTRTGSKYLKQSFSVLGYSYNASQK